MIVDTNGKGVPKPQARILVGVPSGDQVQAMFAYSLARMMAYTSLTLVGPGQPIEWLKVFFVPGTLIAPQRRDIAATALAHDATHVLWIDSDTTFPRDALNRLLARNLDYVGIVQSGRRPPFAPTAFIWETPGQPTPVFVYPGSSGLLQVDALGFGFTLCRTDVFRRVQEPWFPIRWGHLQNGEWAINGEDVGFQEWARKAGFQLFVDLDLSKECGHLGVCEYRCEHPIAFHEELKADGRFRVNDDPLSREYRGGADLVADTPKLMLVEGGHGAG